MKMICIKNEDIVRFFGVLPLTLGQVYEVIAYKQIPFSPFRPFDFSGTVYTVINDNGEVGSYSADILRKLNQQEERELKLDELGI